jgi:hypothetical protein
MQNLHDSTSPYLSVFLKSLPTIAIAGLAFIAVQHAPSTEVSRMFLSTVVAISVFLNGLYGPRLWHELARARTELK